MIPSRRVSVIVLLERGESEAVLSSLLAQEGVEFEILAVAGEEAVLAHLPSAEERVQGVLTARRNPAFRRNLAAGRARGEYLAFIDDDAEAPPEWLRQGVEYLESFPLYAGITGPNLAPSESSFREHLTDLILTTPLIGAGSRAYQRRGRGAPARPGEVHLVNLIVRREWFERVNGFNEEVGYGGEDTEFVYQVARLGGRFWFEPSLVVYHWRRPFGPAYFWQRFRLRWQSGRLFAVYPRVYLKSILFWVAVLALPAGVLFLLLAWSLGGWLGVGTLGLAYVLLVLGLAGLRRPRPLLLLFAPAAFLLHHLVNLAGLWAGLISALLTLSRLRRRLSRSPSSCTTL